MLNTFANDQNKGFYQRLIIIFGIYLQMQFRMFMDTHCIFDFKYIQLLIGHIAPAEIPSLGNGRYLHIFPIG